MCHLAVGFAKRTPEVVPASAPATAFSADRAMAHVRQIAARPHPSGSEAHAATRAYIVGEITKLGLTPEIQSTTGVGTRYAVVGHVDNILVRVPGAQPGGPAVLLAAHYDGVGAGPAAGDDATGSAALLETLRALRAGPPLAHDVILLFTDSEEAGLLGAAAFVREHKWAKDAAVILNFEARGVNGPSLMFETGRGNLDVARALRGTGVGRGTSLSTAVYRRLPNDTDLSELIALDRPAMNFAFIGGVERYHTSEDDVAHLDPGSVQHHGMQALALARSFANGPLPRPVTADAVFFFFPGLGTFVYPESFAIYIAIAGVLLVVGALVRRRVVDKDRWTSGVIVGFVAALLALVVGGLVGYGLGTGFVGLHRAMASGEPRFSETYAVAVAFAVLACTIAAHRVAVHFRNAVAVEGGAVLLWSLLSVVVAVMMPGASFLLAWPVIAAAAALYVSPSETNFGGPLNWIAAAVAIVMVVPTGYLMVVAALGLDAVGGAILGVFVAMGATLARPVLVQSSDRWLPLTVPALAAAWAAIVGMSSVRTSPEHPVGASLVFVTDADSGRAYATGSFAGAVGAKWVDRAIGGANVKPSELPAWMQRVAGTRPTLKSERFVSPLVAPKVTVLKDSSSVGSRHVLVRVQPGSRNTLGISLELDTGRVSSASVDGRAVERDRYRRNTTRWRLDFIAPPDSGFTLGLTLDPADRPRLGVTARVAGLAAWPVALIARPPEVFKLQGGDLSAIRTSVALELPARRRR